MDAQLKAELDNARQDLLETYNLAMSYGSADTHNVETYFEMAAKLTLINEGHKRHQESLDCAKESQTMDDFVNEYQKQLASREAKRSNPKNSSEFKSFKQQLLQIQAMSEDGDTAGGSGTRVEDDEMVMEAEVNVFDPLTKQRMTNPMRNTLCGHHYEQSSIMEAIQINKRLRCPVAGCGNKQFVIQQHLVEDNKFKKSLQQMAEQEESE